MRFSTFIIVILNAAFFPETPNANPTRYPILLVPGDGGNQLWAKLNKSSVPHYLCKKQTADYYDLWLNLEELLPEILDCFTDNMRVVYDEISRKTMNVQGVSIMVPGWGNTSSVEYLDPSEISPSTYFAKIVQNATQWGYVRGKSIRAAPYDFRKAPNEFKRFFHKVKLLIEIMYLENGNQPVVLIAHSMGNPVMLQFYQNQTQDWKTKYLRAHISLGAPWGGSAKVVRMFASGYNMDHYSIFLRPLKLRTMQRSFPSSAYLLPSDKFWKSTDVLVSVGNKTYTVENYKQFFEDIQFEDGWEMHLDTKDFLNVDIPPQIEVHCLVGTNMPTPESFTYSPGYFPDYQPTAINGDGDGTVNIRSLRGCLRWKATQTQKVVYREFPQQEHLQMLQAPEIIAYIKTVVVP